MDGSLWAIVITFIIDVIIFLILLLLFLCFRKARSKKFPGSGSDPHPAFIQEGEFPLCQVIKQVWKTTDAELLQHCHVEGAMYYLMHRNLAYLFAVISVIGMAVLVSVYSQGNSTVLEEVEQVGIAHVVNEETMLIASFLCMVLFTLLGSLVMYRFFTLNRKCLSENTPETVVCIDNIPGALEPYQCAAQVSKALHPFLETGNFDVAVAPNWAKAFELFKEVVPIRARRMELEEFYRLNPDTPRKKVGCCKKTDELETCLTKEKALVEKVKTAINVSVKDLNSGSAFVVTDSKETAINLFKQLKSQVINDESLGQKLWKVTMFGGPENVLWDCLYPSGRGLICKRILLLVGFIIVAFVFLTPTGFLEYIVLIFNSVGGSGAEGFIGQFLPTIVLFLYMNILLPWFIEWLVRKEQHRTNSGSRISAMRKYSFFFTVYLYLVPLIGFQIVQLIDTVTSGNVGDLLYQMESRFTKTGLFFFIYMIHATFIKNGVTLLNPGILISRKLGERKALLPATKEKAYWTQELNVPLDLTMTLVCVMMALSFAVIMPILVPLTCLFLIFKTAFMKYNLLCVNFVNPKTRGKLIYSAVTNFLLSIIAFQLLTCFVLMITHFTSWLTLGAIVAASTVVQFVIFLLIEKREEKRSLEIANVNTKEGETEHVGLVAQMALSFQHPLTQEFGQTPQPIEVKSEN